MVRLLSIFYHLLKRTRVDLWALTDDLQCQNVSYGPNRMMRRPDGIIPERG